MTHGWALIQNNTIQSSAQTPLLAVDAHLALGHEVSERPMLERQYVGRPHLCFLLKVFPGVVARAEPIQINPRAAHKFVIYMR